MGIEPKWVVTAAHCLEKGATSVRLGAYDITNPSPDEVEVNVVGKYMHATYDIALLELEREVESTNCISPVSLPAASVENSPHDNCFVTGWGWEGPDGNKRVTILQEGKMSFQSSDQCDLQPDPSQVCFAGSNSTSVWHGESGGPLVCKDDKSWTTATISGDEWPNTRTTTTIPGDEWPRTRTTTTIPGDKWPNTRTTTTIPGDEWPNTRTTTTIPGDEW